jgi:serine protease
MNHVIAKRIGLLLLSLLVAFEAGAYVDPPTFFPANPSSHHVVVMNFRTGYCDSFAPEEYRAADVSVNGEFVDVVIDGIAETGVHCIFPPVTENSYSIGRFAAGSYQVRLFRRSFNPPFPVGTVPYFVAPLEISNPKPASIPGFGPAAGALLTLIVATVACFVLRNARTCVVSAMIFAGILTTSDGFAASELGGPIDPVKRISVLLSGANGAPTPENIVQHDFASAAKPPLAGLEAEQPIAAAFLMLPRAEAEFSSYLRESPDLPRAKLERYVVVTYSNGSDVDAALQALKSDPFVTHAHLSTLDHGSDFLPIGAKSGPTPPPTKALASQQWQQHVLLPEAWKLAGGWGLVGVLDGGIQTSHPDFSAFDAANNLIGGNLLGDYTLDVGRAGFPNAFPEYNVDELQPEPLAAWPAACDPDNDGWMVPNFVGHGTHVLGLIGANADNGNTVTGACRHCGLSMMRISYLICSNLVAGPSQSRNPTATARGITLQTDIGVQVISMSFGSAEIHPETPDCSVEANDSFCLALAYAASRGVVVAAASGNDREHLDFPASQTSVVAVGGTGDGLEPWDEDTIGPDFFDACPFPGASSECGSNWTVISNGPRQEVALPARKVLSTVYTGKNYNNDIECGDSYGTPLGDGVGTCSGTSMSTPIYAGIVGLVRSVNPLVGAGDPDEWVSAWGVRDVVAYSGVLPGKIEGWSQKLGYGRPQADSAVAAMLGTSNGVPLKNRLTPLFALYSVSASDWAYAATPQSAVGLIHYSAAAYLPQGPLVRGYLQFPGAEVDIAPRASALVFTTEFKTDASHPDLTPLYWMSLKRSWPAGCSGAGCNLVNTDHFLATSQLDVKTLRSDGFAYRGLQGYVHETCAPEPSCVPAGAQKLFRKCKSSDDDCAVFLEGERVAMESQGYTAAYPAGSATLLGYAYPNAHSDKDDLPDAFENLLGTNAIATDSDRDGLCDDLEFPPAGVPLSDPCGNGQCAPTTIFGAGFESDGCS